jgi:hypothetical protein
VASADYPSDGRKGSLLVISQVKKGSEPRKKGDPVFDGPAFVSILNWERVIYQLDFRTPGMSPSCAISRRTMREIPNLR